MIKELMVGFLIVTVMFLVGFNEFYRLVQLINWMALSFLLLALISIGIIIKVWARER